MNNETLSATLNSNENLKSDDRKPVNYDWEKTLELIRDATLMDDFFFKRCFQDNIPAAELTIRIILGNDNLQIVDLKIEQDILSANPKLRSIRMDALAKDAQGRFFNIEIQKTEAGADVRRARYYSAMMDSRMLKAKQPFKELKDSYMIFFTEDDYFGEGFPLYEIDRYISQNGSSFGDGSHIIYINGANKDIQTSLGKLVHDFKCQDPDEFYYKDLKDSVSHFKTTPKGVSNMGQTLTEYAHEMAQNMAQSMAQNMAQSMAQNMAQSMAQNMAQNMAHEMAQKIIQDRTEEYGRECLAKGEAIGRAEGEAIGRAQAEKAFQSQLEALKAEIAGLKAQLQ